MSRRSNPERPCSSYFSWILHKSFNCQTHQLIWHKHPASLQVLYWVLPKHCNSEFFEVSPVPFIKKKRNTSFSHCYRNLATPRFRYLNWRSQYFIVCSCWNPAKTSPSPDHLDIVTMNHQYGQYSPSLLKLQDIFFEFQVPFTPTWFQNKNTCIYIYVYKYCIHNSNTNSQRLTETKRY